MRTGIFVYFVLDWSKLTKLYTLKISKKNIQFGWGIRNIVGVGGHDLLEFNLDHGMATEMGHSCITWPPNYHESHCAENQGGVMTSPGV